MPIQSLQLDDRTFEQLFAEIKARIPVHTPLWTNLNESDPGITIVQLFAFMTENLLYRSNRIPDANRLKFLSLLNISLEPASPGRGLVAFHNDRGPVQAFPFLAGQEVRAGKVPFCTRTDVCILPVTAVPYYKQPQPNLDQTTREQFQMLFQTFLSSSADQLQFYKAKQLAVPAIGKPLPMVDLADPVNGTIDRALWLALIGPRNVPVSTIRAAIAGQTLSLGFYPTPPDCGVVLLPAASQDNRPVKKDPGLIFEIAAPNPDPMNPDTGFGTGPAKYTRLLVDYAENVLETPGIVQVKLPTYDRLLLWDFDPEEEGTNDFPPLLEDKDLAKRLVTWIRVSLSKADPNAARDGASGTVLPRGRLTWVGANAARVIQAVCVDKEPLGVGTGAPDQTYKVANTPVIVKKRTQPDQTSSFRVEVQDVNNVWVLWKSTDDLFAAKPTDMVYTLDPESGQVTFGSGLHGLRPPLGKNIRVSYEYGGGLVGQVAIGALNKSPRLPGGINVENPLPTWGASEGDTVTDGERKISRYLRNRDRLVTSNDFRDITLHTPGVNVERVEVLPLFNPDLFDPLNITQTWPGVLTVMVLPPFDQDSPEPPAPNAQFLQTIAARLEPRRLVTTEVYVREPEYVKIWVSVGVIPMAGQLRETVLHDVQAAIRAYLSPLIGGTPTVSELTLEADCPSSVVQNNACATRVGTGWPLSTNVRVHDLEAIATRVNGVRYIRSIQLGQLSNDGTEFFPVSSVPLVGLQLPWLAGIGVREGAAEDVRNLLGQPPSTGVLPPKVVPVPLLPSKC